MGKIRQIGALKFGAALVGLGFFVGAFVMLWVNEGRLDYAKVARNSLSISATDYDPAWEGQLVAAYGEVHIAENIGDPPFLPPGEYLSVERVVEMFAWREERETDEDDNTITTYQTEWSEGPADSSEFQDPEGHFNPAMYLEGRKIYPSAASMSRYSIDLREMILPQAESMNLLALEIEPSDLLDQSAKVEGKYIYIGTASLDKPEIGDLRISYLVVSLQKEATVFGRLEDKRIGPYEVRRGEALYRLFFTGRETAIAVLGEEYRSALWGMRAAGFFTMWCGLFLLLNPLTLALAILPKAERFGLMVIGAAVLPLVALLTVLTVAIGFLFHNPLWLIFLVGLALAGVTAVLAAVYLLGVRREG